MQPPHTLEGLEGQKVHKKLCLRLVGQMLALDGLDTLSGWPFSGSWLARCMMVFPTRGFAPHFRSRAEEVVMEQAQIILRRELLFPPCFVLAVRIGRILSDALIPAVKRPEHKTSQVGQMAWLHGLCQI